MLQFLALNFGVLETANAFQGVHSWWKPPLCLSWPKLLFSAYQNFVLENCRLWETLLISWAFLK